MNVEVFTVLVYARKKMSTQEILNEYQLSGFTHGEIEKAIQFINKKGHGVRFLLHTPRKKMWVIGSGVRGLLNFENLKMN